MFSSLAGAAHVPVSFVILSASIFVEFEEKGSVEKALKKSEEYVHDGCFIVVRGGTEYRKQRMTLAARMQRMLAWYEFHFLYVRR